MRSICTMRTRAPGRRGLSLSLRVCTSATIQVSAAASCHRCSYSLAGAGFPRQPVDGMRHLAILAIDGAVGLRHDGYMMAASHSTISTDTRTTSVASPAYFKCEYGLSK
jgi:hypothetical protein